MEADHEGAERSPGVAHHRAGSKRGKPELGRQCFFLYMQEYSDIIAITGHRDYPDRAALYRGIDNMSARQYYFGGAKGIDSDALEYIARTQPGSVRTVVVPNRLADQPASARVIINKHATNVIELRNSGPDRYMIRNRFMVDNSTRTDAFYDYRGKGGTFNTIEYARYKGKLGTVNSLREYEVDEFRDMSTYEFHDTMVQMRNYKVNFSAVKMLFLEMIIKVFKMAVDVFFKSLGYVGVKTVEAFWSL